MKRGSRSAQTIYVAAVTSTCNGGDEWADDKPRLFSTRERAERYLYENIRTRVMQWYHSTPEGDMDRALAQEYMSDTKRGSMSEKFANLAGIESLCDMCSVFREEHVTSTVLWTVTECVLDKHCVTRKRGKN